MSTKRKNVRLFLSFFSTAHSRPSSKFALTWLSSSSFQNEGPQLSPNQMTHTQQHMTRAQVISLLKQLSVFRVIFKAASRQKGLGLLPQSNYSCSYDPYFGACPLVQRHGVFTKVDEGGALQMPPWGIFLLLSEPIEKRVSGIP